MLIPSNQKDKVPTVRTRSMACRNCGHNEFDIQERSETIDFRGLTLDVEGLNYSICKRCGAKSETRDQQVNNDSIIKSAYSLERDELRKRDGLLSSHEIEAIRKNFALTQREAAVVFGGGANAFNKYESGEVLQSVSMDRLLRLIDAAGVPALSFLEKIAQRVRPDFHLPCLTDELTTSRKATALQVIISDELKTYNLAITNSSTASGVLAAIRGTTFSESLGQPQPHAALFYSNAPSGPPNIMLSEVRK